MSRSGGRLVRSVRIEVWSDVVCPWCYIGKRRLEAALERFPHRDDVEVVWRSFQLDPGIPEGETHETLPALAARFGRPVEDVRGMMRHVEETAAGEGLHYDLANGISGNTLLAHEVLHLAAERGLQGAVAERLLHAHFAEGRSVFDVDSLAALAGEVGLDDAEVRAALADHRYRPAVRDDIRTARELGVNGVPFFVVDGRYGASGAQPADLLLQLLERAWAEADAVAS
jgi:predicted DsbA family dithiol-disulfide isomerase